MVLATGAVMGSSGKMLPWSSKQKGVMKGQNSSKFQVWSTNTWHLSSGCPFGSFLKDVELDDLTSAAVLALRPQKIGQLPNELACQP